MNKENVNFGSILVGGGGGGGTLPQVSLTTMVKLWKKVKYFTMKIP